MGMVSDNDQPGEGEVINATLQVSLPVERVADLQRVLQTIIQLHDKEAAALERRARVEVSPARLVEASDRVRRAKIRLTVQHLIRAYVTLGLEKTTPTPADLLEAMISDDVSAGRPGVKRGSRAA